MSFITLSQTKYFMGHDNRDPPWMNDRIKHPIKKERTIFQKQRESNTGDHVILSDITLELSNATSFSKVKYHFKVSINATLSSK